MLQLGLGPCLNAYLGLLQVSNQAFQDEFVSFGNGYKYALPTDDASDFGCTLPNGRYQVRVGGIVLVALPCMRSCCGRDQSCYKM